MIRLAESASPAPEEPVVNYLQVFGFAEGRRPYHLVLFKGPLYLLRTIYMMIYHLLSYPSFRYTQFFNPLFNLGYFTGFLVERKINTVVDQVWVCVCEYR